MLRYPDLTIESFANEPASAAETERHIQTMRLAASRLRQAGGAGELEKPMRLPECEAEQTIPPGTP